MAGDFDDLIDADEELEDEDALEEEELEGKLNKSQTWRAIEALREERRLQKQLEREYALDISDDDLDDLDDLDD